MKPKRKKPTATIEAEKEIICILLDSDGYPGWKLAKLTGDPTSRISVLLNGLAEKDVVERGLQRPSTNPKRRRKKGEYPEHPYYLACNIHAFETILNMLTEGLTQEDAFYMMGVLETSQYGKDIMLVFEKEAKRILEIKEIVISASTIDEK